MNGSGKANVGHQIDGSVGVPVGQDVEEVVHDGLDPRPQALDRARRERGRHETTQPGVVRRVDGEHVPGELGPREALGHDPAVQGERGVHVLGEPGVVERLAGLVVTHHQPGVVAVGQGDVVHRAELPDLGEEREGVVAVEGAPGAERRLVRCALRSIDVPGCGSTALFVTDEPRAQNRAVTDPVPQLDGPAQPGVEHERRLVEPPGVEADRADEQLAAGRLEALHQVRGLGEQPFGRDHVPRTCATPSVARRPLSLVEEHEGVPAGFGGADGHQEGDGHLLRDPRGRWSG